jgi:hypothetical protein
MGKSRNKSSPEVRECSVRMVGEHRADYGSEWEGMTLIAGRLAVRSRRWAVGAARRQANERDQRRRRANERERLKALEREMQELHRAD